MGTWGDGKLALNSRRSGATASLSLNKFWPYNTIPKIQSPEPGFFLFGLFLSFCCFGESDSSVSQILQSQARPWTLTWNPWLRPSESASRCFDFSYASSPPFQSASLGGSSPAHFPGTCILRLPEHFFPTFPSASLPISISSYPCCLATPPCFSIALDAVSSLSSWGSATSLAGTVLVLNLFSS